MNRREVINAFAETRGDAVVVTGPGISSGMLWEAGPHPATIYNMDMAYCGPMCMGIAIGAPKQRVVSIEGDGSRFAATPALATMVRYPLANLTLLTVCNGIWGTGDGITATSIAPDRWSGLVIALGWDPERVIAASDLASLRPALQRSATEPGPWFISAVITSSPEDSATMPDGTRRKRPRSTIDIVQSADSTRQYLLALEKS